ncbi:MAG: LysM peptidoglycan-binding domain-containing protein [Phycisphaerae bacterium]
MRRSAIVPALMVILVACGCNKPKPEEDMQDAGTATAVLQPDFYTADPAAEVTDPDSYTAFPSTDPVMLAQAPVVDSNVNAYGTHVVVKGDTLFGLARTYYNDQSRWKDIYAANADRLKSPDVLFVGQELVIP